MTMWGDILGHERVKDVLERAIATDRLHHALLFVGPVGVGKRALALRLAQLINCTAHPPGAAKPACGSCSSCRKVLQNQHPDLHIIEPEGAKLKAIKIQQVRDLQKLCHNAPFEARDRVVIFDDVHRMNEEAANALLKTLEEPTPRTRMILISDQPHLLLDTILSRCQRMRFGALERAQAATRLAQLVRDDRALAQLDPALLDVAAAFGEGSVGRALELLRGGLLSERGALLASLRALDHQQTLPRLELAEQLGKQNDQLLEQLDLLRALLRDVMRYQVNPDPSGLISRDMASDIAQLAAKMSVARVLEAIEQIATAQTLLERYVNPQLVMEQLLHHLTPDAPRRASRALPALP